MINFSGAFAALRFITNPSLGMPHGTVSTFNDIPIPVSKTFVSASREKPPDIRAVILDKDNCFAVPRTDTVYPPYENHFRALHAAYPKTLLILSNTAGYAARDPKGSSAAALTSTTGVPVLSHDAPKPHRACAESIMEYFAARPELGVTHPSQVAVVGDRLLTDVFLANTGGFYGLWVRDGVVREGGMVGMIISMEKATESFLRRRGFEAPEVASPFE